MTPTDPGNAGPEPAEPEPVGREPDDGDADHRTADTVDPRRPGAEARERIADGDEDEAERYADSPGAGLAGALDDLPEPNEPG